MTRMHRQLFLSAAVIAALVAGSGAPIGANGGAGSPQRTSAHRGSSRLDSALRAVVDDGTLGPQRVIVRVRPERRDIVRQSLTAHGDHILADHDSIGAFTAIVHQEDLAELGENDAILSVSADAIVRPHGLLGGLLGGLLRVVGGVVNVAADVLLPNGADTAGPVVAPELLRQTLGVDNSAWTGQGVGVAVIDSGLEMSSEFQNRVTAFYDFTNGGFAAKAPFDDYGHGTHVAGIIGGSGALSSNGAYHGLAPKVKLRHPEGAGQERRRLHERRHPRDRLRRGE